MKSIICVLIILISNLLVMGQSNYYVTDSMINVGVEIIDRGSENFQFCAIETSKGIIKLTPHEVNKYSFGESIFVARDIVINDSERRVFLEKLTHGNLTLYYYRDKKVKLYFLEDSIRFYSLSKNHQDELFYKQILQGKTGGYPHSVRNLHHLPFTKFAMRQFVKRHNEYDTRPMQFLRYGIYFGANSMSLSPSIHNNYLDLNNFSFTKSYWFFGGVFLEKPIHFSNFSALFSLDISQISGSYARAEEFTNTDILHKSTSVNAPLMARYTYRRHILSPYINAGASLWYDISNYSIVYKANRINNEVSIAPPVNLPISDNMGVGLVAGVGLDLRITRSNSLLFEFRYIRQNVFKNNDNNALHFNKTGTQFYAGISF
jgi:hypothetical protein